MLTERESEQLVRWLTNKARVWMVAPETTVWQMFSNAMGTERQRPGVEPCPTPALYRGILERRGHKVRGRGLISLSFCPSFLTPTKGVRRMVKSLRPAVGYCEGCGVAAVIGDHSVFMGIGSRTPTDSQILWCSCPFYKMAKHLRRPVASLYPQCVISGLFKTPNAMERLWKL